jgi:hypothetical protein
MHYKKKILITKKRKVALVHSIKLYGSVPAVKALDITIHARGIWVRTTFLHNSLLCLLHQTFDCLLYIYDICHVDHVKHLSSLVVEKWE